MGTTRTGGVRRRRRLARAVAAAAVLVGTAVPLALPTAAAAVPQPDSDSDSAASPAVADPAEKAALLLERRVRQRERVLRSITVRAANYEEVKEDEAHRLAVLAYTGPLADVTHVLPLAGYRLSATYGLAGPHWEHDHTGLDFAAPLGTTLVAVGDGVVTSVADSGAYGLRTIITLRDGTEVWYCHQLSAEVEPGDEVKVGQPVGALGSTGNSTGPHLHLEVRPPGIGPVDPMSWLEALELAP